MSVMQAVIAEPESPDRLALAEIGEVAGRLMERAYAGKAVLHVAG